MYRVVIADDEVLIRMYIREILENNGYEVVGEAEDGLDAIAVCRQKKPDFVIMDINMPVMTGLEATKVINEDKQHELASEFGIMSIPTLVVMKNGKIVQQVSGARPKEAILTMI